MEREAQGTFMRVVRQQFTLTYSYPVVFTRNALDPENAVLADIVRQGGRPGNRVLVVIDSGVMGRAPHLAERLRRYEERYSELLNFFPLFIMPGGEACKNDPSGIERLLAQVERHGLCRHSFILAVGGGAVLDAAGLAAATAHRGIRLIRMPTTVLAQNDAGVGVKNGINAFGKKNFLGTFSPPFAVINDFSFLATLSSRDLRAGIAEAIKVALVRDKAFFDFLHRRRGSLLLLSPPVLEEMIVRCAELHLDHIARGGDPFEKGSSRPLDFGHWSAHRLEEVTKGELRHGEAVSIGMALDATYSCRAGYLGKPEWRRILSVLRQTGLPLYHPALAQLDIERALEGFREHLGGDLRIPLLKGIGEKVEVEHIDFALMRSCVDSLRPGSAHGMTAGPWGASACGSRSLP